MIHCYFFHSFDLNKLTKEERDRVDSVAVGDGDASDSDSEDALRIEMRNNILMSKREKFKFGRGSSKFRDVVDDKNSEDKLVDFVSMSESIGVDENTLNQGLSVYKEDRDRFMGDLIEVVYGDKASEMCIWSSLNVDDEQKMKIFRDILYRYFQCTQLNSENFAKLCRLLIARDSYGVDAHAFATVVMEKGICGRIFDSANSDSFQPVGTFSNHFENVSGYKHQDVRRIYSAIGKWKNDKASIDGLAAPRGSRKLLRTSSIFLPLVDQALHEIKCKKPKCKLLQFNDEICDYFRQNPQIDQNQLTSLSPKALAKSLAEHSGSRGFKGSIGLFKKTLLEKIETVRLLQDDIKVDSDDDSDRSDEEEDWRYEGLEGVKDEVAIGVVQETEHDVYAIGKRFYFWDSHKNLADFVKAKYANMKEEIMNSPILRGHLNMESWYRLIYDIGILLATQAARNIKSNGLDHYMYGIAVFQPLDEDHLLALKLYTDFTKLCKKMCTVLRRGNKAEITQIAHWTSTLIETVQCFGTTFKREGSDKTYWRGVDRTFMFRRIATQFNLPMSTSTVVCQTKCSFNYCVFSSAFMAPLI